MLLNQGHNQSSIARIIGKHRSVVSREIKRNSSEKRGAYHYKTAQKKADSRKQRFHRRRTFTRQKQVFVEEHLKRKWSPGQIVGYCEENDIEMVSHQTIYEYVHDDKALGGTLHTHLRHKLKHRKRPAGSERAVIEGKVSIEERPDVVDQKTRLGDWEVDTIVGKGNKGAILTIVERKTGFLIAEKLEQGKKAKPLARELVRLLLPFKEVAHTITSDNGSEFAEHEYIARMLDARFYFAHPYSSWERGLNEYTNKLIRQYIPKKESFDKYNKQDVKRVQYELNKRPRKKLKFEAQKKYFSHLC